jgi:hypothetical protein
MYGAVCFQEHHRMRVADPERKCGYLRSSVMENYTDELYEMLDELNARIEEIIDEHPNPGDLELIMPMLQQKIQIFIDDFEQEVEKMEMIET